MNKLDRLTTGALRAAESRGKAAGWYELCRRGYLPAEIAVYAEPMVYANDIVQRVREHATRHGLPLPVTVAPRKIRERAAPPEDWRAAFRSSVMRTGMCLALTQPMLEFLCATADGVKWDRQLIGGSSLARPCNSIATASSLEKRGLLRRRAPLPALPPLGDPDESIHELTEAGRIVVELLKSVGVFIEADIAIGRRSERS